MIMLDSSFFVLMRGSMHMEPKWLIGFAVYTRRSIMLGVYIYIGRMASHSRRLNLWQIIESIIGRVIPAAK